MRQIALACAVLSLILMGLTVFVGPVPLTHYNHWTQYISELGATGSLTGDWVSGLFIASGLLLAAFWLMAAFLFPVSVASVIGCCLSALNGLGLLFGGVFPCDVGCTPNHPTVSQILHDVFGGFGYFAGVIGVFLIGAAARRWPHLWGRRLFILSLICGLPAALAVWLIGPEFAWHGAAQRIVEIALAVFTLASALALQQRRWGRSKL